MYTNATNIHSEIDPVTLGIIWSRMIAMVDEAATTLIRTSFSTIVREFERSRSCADR